MTFQAIKLAELHQRSASVPLDTRLYLVLYTTTDGKQTKNNKAAQNFDEGPVEPACFSVCQCESRPQVSQTLRDE